MNVAYHPLLAAAADFDLIRHGTSPIGRPTVLALTDILLIVGAALTVALLLILWALYRRKSRRHRHHRHHRHSGNHQPPTETDSDQTDNEESPEEEEEEESAHYHQHHRRRVRRRDHRQRNPTLAETGGLPPIRPAEPPNSPHGQ
jgi:FtsZ-interacting cell division protein ZipA